MRSMPLARRAARAQSSRRRPATSAKHLGVSAVVGIRRWPRPAPMMMACMVGDVLGTRGRVNLHSLPLRTAAPIGEGPSRGGRMAAATADVVVIGGGIVGLATAMHLTAGWRVALRVLEAEDRLAAHQT